MRDENADDWIVELQRGSKHIPLTYGPESKARASQRVSSLTLLHGDCPFRVDHDNHKMFVDASKYYNTAKTRKENSK